MKLYHVHINSALAKLSAISAKKHHFNYGSLHDLFIWFMKIARYNINLHKEYILWASLTSSPHLDHYYLPEKSLVFPQYLLPLPNAFSPSHRAFWQAGVALLFFNSNFKEPSHFLNSVFNTHFFIKNNVFLFTSYF